MKSGGDAVEAIRQHAGVLAQLPREAVARPLRGRPAEYVRERPMLSNQPGGLAPRRDRLEALDQASADERAGTVALLPRPVERVKLRDERGYLGASRPPTVLTACGPPSCSTSSAAR